MAPKAKGKGQQGTTELLVTVPVAPEEPVDLSPLTAALHNDTLSQTAAILFTFQQLSPSDRVLVSSTRLLCDWFLGVLSSSLADLHRTLSSETTSLTVW